jgi:hypothetical protein
MSKKNKKDAAMLQRNAMHFRCALKPNKIGVLFIR